jgi:HlyD family secretion protein
LKRTWVRWALGLGFATILLAGAYLAYARRPLTVDVAAVETNVPIRVFGLGTVEARVLSKIGFEVGATLAELKADHGDRVAKGQVLTHLNSGEQEAKLAKAKAALLIAEVNIKRAEANLERARAGLAQKNSGNV